MPHVASDGARLYYEEHGAGPALVLLHGAGTNHIAWYQQVPAFRDRDRCITLDQRGFGWSRDETGESAGRATADLAAVLDARGNPYRGARAAPTGQSRLGCGREAVSTSGATARRRRSGLSPRVVRSSRPGVAEGP